VHKRAYDLGIYLDSAIAETAEAYGELMSITLNTDDGVTTATFDNVEDLMYVDAFSNHALFLSIQAYRNGGEA